MASAQDKLDAYTLGRRNARLQQQPSLYMLGVSFRLWFADKRPSEWHELLDQYMLGMQHGNSSPFYPSDERNRSMEDGLYNRA
jgi:hypothetical protein